ncbi:hypothetical protein WJX72_000186 [[Myrmecia] bisecta]|uniref:F-box domain-containing protein n=1 Tax=[Myrmecia] bisecta TaxID=41462 RepID=A0AAW1PS37_9CHLO
MAHAVLFSPDLLGLILARLHLRQALQLSAVCKKLKAEVTALIPVVVFAPRLVVASSGSKTILELDLGTGHSCCSRQQFHSTLLSPYMH